MPLSVQERSLDLVFMGKELEQLHLCDQQSW